MYFVNREKIDETLAYMDLLLNEWDERPSLDTLKDKLAMERMVTVIVESIIDVGNSMIDGFIMRDPGSYEDIVDILHDEKVIHEQDANSLKQVVALRKELVTYYMSLDHDKISKVVTKELTVLTQFSSNVRRYLVEELGPVSAFLPNKK
ncbi:DUF86 domain-containing protein [Bacillus sp. FJAT-45037]|uniref:DUF86 domain-containing protein n=1 Tax=Bacillus sp. FJAT-45037 TaxID=2011007 RepID=UPI000C247CD4|nr:DUF86 domain-containing protein [Bacillus sp. FJAT-45037]